ncbi:MAG: hypothetical protein DRI57_13740, partial [Deltaproteobacteria bacterium]
MGGANVTNVAGSCVALPAGYYLVSGVVTGLTDGETIVLLNNGGDDLVVYGNGSFTFATALADGEDYHVTVSSSSGNLGINVALGSGTVSVSNVTDVTVTCGTEFTNSIGMEFVWIPPGTFTMGSPESELSSNNSERPQHDVTFANGFWIAKYEVTQSQWQTVMGNNPSFYNDGGSGPNTNPDNPVEQVNWDDCKSFMAAMYAVDSDNYYALPSEAQWEYACRGGITEPYYDVADDISWHSGNSANITYAVGQKVPNTFGIYDMSGNVFEWCGDTWHSNYTDAPTDGSSWEVDGSTNRVIRGGSFFNPATLSRSAFRYSIAPAGAYYNLGFRPVILKGSDVPFTIGGTVSGLGSGETLVLQNNGGDDLTITQNGSFVFATWLDTGEAYDVTVQTQPDSQLCIVSGGSGTLSETHITDVGVVCDDINTDDAAIIGNWIMNGFSDSDFSYISFMDNGHFICLEQNEAIEWGTYSYDGQTSLLTIGVLAVNINTDSGTDGNDEHFVIAGNTGVFVDDIDEEDGSVPIFTRLIDNGIAGTWKSEWPAEGERPGGFDLHVFTEEGIYLYGFVDHNETAPHDVQYAIHSGNYIDENGAITLA